MKVWFAGKICLEKSKIRDLEGQHHVSNVEHLKEKKGMHELLKDGSFQLLKSLYVWEPRKCGQLI